jgi:hypothetical protein
MKKLVFLILGIIIITGFSAFTQPNEVTSAWNYSNEYELAKAKAAIDRASQHPLTINNPKTWTFMGEIYGKIALTDKDEFAKLCDTALEAAYSFVLKSMEMDKSNQYLADNKDVLVKWLSNAFFNSGATTYNIASEIGTDTVTNLSYIKPGKSLSLCKLLLVLPDTKTKTNEGKMEFEVWSYGTCNLTFTNGVLKEINGNIPESALKKLKSPLTSKILYKNALNYFDKFWEIMDKLGGEKYYVEKNLSESNIKLQFIQYYTGKCAAMIKDNDKARKYLSAIIDMKSDEITAKTNTVAEYYVTYALFLSGAGYFKEATEVIERAMFLWPENKNLILVELKIFQDNDKINELSDKLRTSLEQDPNNLNLLATYAGTLDMIARDFEEKGDTIKAAEWLQNTANAYQKAIDMTIKYKDELKYKISGSSSSFTVIYLNENGEKKTEKVVSGWEYAFNVKEGSLYSIVGIIKDKKTAVNVLVTLAGSTIIEASNENGKNSASVAGTINKEDLDRNNNLYSLYYSLGVLYFNPGVVIYNKSINEQDPKKIKTMEYQYINLFNKALPYLEKAHQISPLEKNSMQVLLNIYLRKNENEKANAINAELKALKKKH